MELSILAPALLPLDGYLLTTERAYTDWAPRFKGVMSHRGFRHGVHATLRAVADKHPELAAELLEGIDQ